MPVIGLLASFFQQDLEHVAVSEHLSCFVLFCFCSLEKHTSWGYNPAKMSVN